MLNPIQVEQLYHKAQLLRHAVAGLAAHFPDGVVLPVEALAHEILATLRDDVVADVPPRRRLKAVR